jgi:hypothetical protein
MLLYIRSLFKGDRIVRIVGVVTLGKTVEKYDGVGTVSAGAVGTVSAGAVGKVSKGTTVVLRGPTSNGV